MNEKTGLYTPNDLHPVIVRAKDAGVHFGYLVSWHDREVTLQDSRRMWKWKTVTGVALSACATFGIDAKESKLDAKVKRIVILDACEIIGCTEDAVVTFESAWAQ